MMRMLVDENVINVYRTVYNGSSLLKIDALHIIPHRLSNQKVSKVANIERQ